MNMIDNHQKFDAGKDMNEVIEAVAQPGECIRGKWVMDDATTLEEAAICLESMAVYLRDLHAKGWTLLEPIQDDYGFLVDPSGDKGEMFEDDIV